MLKGEVLKIIYGQSEFYQAKAIDDVFGDGSLLTTISAITCLNAKEAENLLKGKYDINCFSHKIINRTEE